MNLLQELFEGFPALMVVAAVLGALVVLRLLSARTAGLRRTHREDRRAGPQPQMPFYDGQRTLVISERRSGTERRKGARERLAIARGEGARQGVTSRRQ
ncbi:MAG: hypothetical protein JSW10_10170 [Pseudomonadota bacterium]|nr:MAG: hypothetical protein JSW10_10170 [Pseudomonadota bacterium]